MEGADRGGDAALEVGGAATPEDAVDDRGAERILALGAGPALSPALGADGVEVACEQERSAAAASARDAPDDRPPRLDLLHAHLVKPEQLELRCDEAPEGKLVAGHARRAHGALQELDGSVLRHRPAPRRAAARPRRRR